MNAQEIQNKLASIQSKIKLIEADMSRPEAYEGEYDYLSGILAKFLGVERQLTAMLSQTSVVPSVNETTETKQMNAKETARQIKKALNAAFNNGKPKEEKIKFSVTSRYISGMGHTRVTISWVGGVFVDDVKAIAEQWNTYVNHSDSMTDYSHSEGVKIVYDRSLSADDIAFLQQCVIPEFPSSYNVKFLQYRNCDGYFVEIYRDGYYVGSSDDYFHQMITQYNKTGSISEEVSKYEVFTDNLFQKHIVAFFEGAEFKTKQQQQDGICRKLSGFLTQMPRDRQNSIMHQIKTADDPNAYMQSLLSAMESIEASGF